MRKDNGLIKVFYDGACPSCVQDRRFYQRLAGKGSTNILWLDLNGHEVELKALGIDPFMALTELYIQLEDGQILSELDAYIVLLSRVWILSPLAWLISLPFIRPKLANYYHRRVMSRLKASGRL
jgi:predicted DCC family thiol-disulfide oxidoreductase YuxK